MRGALTRAGSSPAPGTTSPNTQLPSAANRPAWWPDVRRVDTRGFESGPGHHLPKYSVTKRREAARLVATGHYTGLLGLKV